MALLTYRVQMFYNVAAKFFYNRLNYELNDLVEVEGAEAVYLQHARELHGVDAVRVEDYLRATRVHGQLVRLLGQQHLGQRYHCEI